jgi:hypothetical protein
MSVSGSAASPPSWRRQQDRSDVRGYGPTNRPSVTDSPARTNGCVLFPAAARSSRFEEPRYHPELPTDMDTPLHNAAPTRALSPCKLSEIQWSHLDSNQGPLACEADAGRDSAHLSPSQPRGVGRFGTVRWGWYGEGWDPGTVHTRYTHGTHRSPTGHELRSPLGTHVHVVFMVPAASKRFLT